MLPIEYVAGFFDGEGCVGIYGYRTAKGRRFVLRTQVTQVDNEAARSMLEELRNRFGGSVSTQSTSSGRGKLNWQASGDTAAAFLEEMLPFLVLKREQASIAVAWQRCRPKPRRDGLGRVLASSEANIASNEATAQLMALLKRL